MENGKYNHTPGPWSVETEHTALPFIWKEGIGAIAEISGDAMNRPDKDVNLANAILIAASPDLLEALREASRALTLIDPLAAHHNAKMIDNALAKARGEQ